MDAVEVSNEHVSAPYFCNTYKWYSFPVFRMHLGEVLIKYPWKMFKLSISGLWDAEAFLLFSYYIPMTKNVTNDFHEILDYTPTE